MDTPEQQNEMGQIMQRDAAIKDQTEPILKLLKNFNFCIQLHNKVLEELLERVEALERGLIKEKE